MLCVIMISFMQNKELGCKEDKKNGHKCDADPVSKVTNTPLAGQPSTEEEANVLKFHNEGKLVNSISGSCQVRKSL